MLWHEGRWVKPHGATPTTHLIKTQIGKLPGGIDLSDSVENEYYCLKLAAAFGLPVNNASIETFGETKALVIERFDRRWTKDGRLLRLPQEDCCQALSVPPTLKYQNEGGPGMYDVLNLLKGSDTPIEDQDTFLKAQIIFWLMGATDAHAKNFSVFLGPGGSYRMTPLYDVVTAQAALDARQIERKQMRMAMSVGTNRHYRFDQIHGRHFVQTAVRAGMSKKRATGIVEEIAARAPDALYTAANALPAAVPSATVETVSTAVMDRIRGLDCLVRRSAYGRGVALDRLGGRYRRARLFRFSTEPFCQGACGSQNQLSVPMPDLSLRHSLHSKPRSKLIDFWAGWGRGSITSISLRMK